MLFPVLYEIRDCPLGRSISVGLAKKLGSKNGRFVSLKGSDNIPEVYTLAVGFE